MAQHGNLIDVDLEEQVAALRKELGALKKNVAKRGSDFYGDTGDRVSDYLGELSERFVPSMAGIRTRARAAERVAYDHPAVVATVGLLVIGLAVSLFFRTRSVPEPVRSRPQRRSRSRST